MCVRGNCDTEVDQMVLDFPVLADYGIIAVENRMIYATHGHKYGPDKLPPLQNGDVLLYGHIHVPKCHTENGILVLNPGSVSIPKENSHHSYMTLEGNLLLWKDLEGDEYQRFVL